MGNQRIDTQKNSIAILGAGTWGTAQARLFAVRGMDVTVWSISAEEVETYTCTRRHPKLPGMQIPSNISFTTEINCVSGKDYVMFAVPSVFIRSTAQKAAPYVTPSQIVMSVAKGIEKGTLLSMTEILHEVLPGNRIVALSGPTHAEEVALDMPTTIVSACEDMAAAEEVRRLFDGSCIRAYVNADVKGVELSGALKNVIALASGIAVGAGFGDNTRAAIITRGLAEIKRLGVSMGCREETFSGLAGIGDLVVTATSMHSRNNKCGMLIGQGVPAAEAVKQVGMVVEGLNALDPALSLAEKHGVEMPVARAVKAVVDGRSAKEVAAALLSKPSSTGDFADR